MPIRLPPITDHASHILLEGLVDYAGLYPPAALAMSSAVRQYAQYRAAGSGWMLGRFVCRSRVAPLSPVISLKSLRLANAIASVLRSVAPWWTRTSAKCSPFTMWSTRRP